MSKHDAVPETTVMKSDVQALVPPAPLRVLGDALLRATREGAAAAVRGLSDIDLSNIATQCQSHGPS
eukprot:g32501.t1